MGEAGTGGEGLPQAAVAALGLGSSLTGFRSISPPRWDLDGTPGARREAGDDARPGRESCQELKESMPRRKGRQLGQRQDDGARRRGRPQQPGLPLPDTSPWAGPSRAPPPFPRPAPWPGLSSPTDHTPHLPSHQITCPVAFSPLSLLVFISHTLGTSLRASVNVSIPTSRSCHSELAWFLDTQQVSSWGLGDRT